MIHQDIETISRFFIYGTEIKAKQPVYLAANKRIYPIIGSKLKLGSKELLDYLGEAGAISLIPTFTNKFAVVFPWEDGKIYSYCFEFEDNGSFIFLSSSIIIEQKPLDIGGTSSLAVSPDGKKAVLVYKIQNLVRILNCSLGSVGVISVIKGAELPQDDLFVCPQIIATDTNEKFLLTGRGAIDVNTLWLVDCTNENPVLTKLDTVTQTATTVKSSWIQKLNNQSYIWVTATNPTNIQFRYFTFDPISNAYIKEGANLNIAVEGTALNIDLVYLEQNEAWFAFTTNKSVNKIQIVKLNLISKTFTAPKAQTFTREILKDTDYSTTVHGHKKSLGNFLINWRTEAKQNVYKCAEYFLNRRTGIISQSVQPKLLPTLTAAPSEYSQYSFSSSATGKEFVIKITAESSKTTLVTFGTLDTLLSNQEGLIGLTRNTGSAETYGIVDLIGSTQEGHIDLIPNKTYYVDIPSKTISTNSTSEIVVGTAISTTQLKIYK